MSRQVDQLDQPLHEEHVSAKFLYDLKTFGAMAMFVRDDAMERNLRLTYQDHQLWLLIIKIGAMISNLSEDIRVISGFVGCEYTRPVRPEQIGYGHFTQLVHALRGPLKQHFISNWAPETNDLADFLEQYAYNTYQNQKDGYPW